MTEVRADTDAAVIEQSWSAPERFAVLYDRYHEVIYRYLARRLGRDLADDLMAETFLVAFGRRHGYDLSRPQALPWLYGIATRLVGGHRRAEVRLWRLIERTGVDAVMQPPADLVADRVSAQAVRPDLARAIAGLPAGQRDVLLLSAVAELSVEEIAAALGVARGTVHSRLSRAKKRTRAALGGSDPTSAHEEGER